METKKDRRIRLTISYDGTEFSGWQRQKHDTTIQGEIEKRLWVMIGEEIFLHGAGRTDAGVHAEAMVAHFDSSSTITDTSFLRGLNSMLPGAIRIVRAETCDPEFHSRFSAVGKHYQYHLYTGAVQPPHTRLYSLHMPRPLDVETIRTCLTYLEGRHDFSSFENAGSRDKSITTGRGATRTLYRARLLISRENWAIFDLIGDGFLKNMVRNIVGTLLEAGSNKVTPEEFRAILLRQERCAAGPTAPAHGLFLKKVYYCRDLEKRLSGSSLPGQNEGGKELFLSGFSEIMPG